MLLTSVSICVMWLLIVDGSRLLHLQIQTRQQPSCGMLTHVEVEQSVNMHQSQQHVQCTNYCCCIFMEVWDLEIISRNIYNWKMLF